MSEQVEGYDPEYNRMLVDHMGEGYSFRSFCTRVGYDLKTLNSWLRENPGFVEARDIGHEQRRLFYETKLIQIIKGEIPKANAQLLIFTLKNCFPDEWRDVVQHDENINFNVLNEPEKLLKMCLDAADWKNEQDKLRLVDTI